MNRTRSIMQLYGKCWFSRIPTRCFLSWVSDAYHVPCVQRLYHRNIYTRHHISRHETHSMFGHMLKLRGFHGSQSVLLSKILSVEEMFSKPSLQEYLNKVEDEYDASLNSVNTMEGQSHGEEELSQKRIRVSVLRPLVQHIGDLRLKQKELEETEELLKGEHFGLIDNVINLNLRSRFPVHL